MFVFQDLSDQWRIPKGKAQPGEADDRAELQKPRWQFPLKIRQAASKPQQGASSTWGLGFLNKPQKKEKPKNEGKKLHFTVKVRVCI